MTEPGCEQYLEDPELHSAHLESCDECRRFSRALAGSAMHEPLVIDAMPMASWEGSAHQSWSLVAGGLLVLVAAIGALSMTLDLPPLEMFRRTFSFPPLSNMLGIAGKVGRALAQAPTALQIGGAAAFLITNLLLVLMLRRPPRGIDAPH